MADAPQNFERLDDVIEYELLKARRLFFANSVGSESTTRAIRKLWYMELTDPGKPITFVINSPGGAIDAGFALWDQIKLISSPVTTLVTGLAASMGSVLSLCAEDGRRFSTPNARFMLHQPLIGGVIEGAVSDIEIQSKELLKTRDKLVKLYMEKTGKSEDVIRKTLDRDTWMSPEEAKDFGLIDKIVTSLDDI